MLLNNALLSYSLCQFSLTVDLQGVFGKDEDLVDAKTQRERGVCQEKFVADPRLELSYPTCLTVSVYQGEILSLLHSVSPSSVKQSDWIRRSTGPLSYTNVSWHAAFPIHFAYSLDLNVCLGCCLLLQGKIGSISEQPAEGTGSLPKRSNPKQPTAQ